MRTFTLSILVLVVSILAIPQAPGTPAYDCHANCGGAITAGRAAEGEQSVLCAPGGDFITQYTACLACVAQPDLSYIWGIYGNSISADGAICGLATGPSTINMLTTEQGRPSTTTQPTAISDAPNTQATMPPVSTSTITPTGSPSTTSETPVATTSDISTFTSGSMKSHGVLPDFAGLIVALVLGRIIFV